MNKLKEEDGFTLIEMLIVLLVISVLMLIVIPNVTKSSKSIDEKGCTAYVLTLQGQVEVYKMDTGGYPTDLSDLVPIYVPEETWENKEAQCLDGTKLSITGGKVAKTGSGS